MSGPRLEGAYHTPSAPIAAYASAQDETPLHPLFISRFRKLALFLTLT